MISFKEFIEEAEISPRKYSVISQEVFVKISTVHCGQSLDNASHNDYIYRGDTDWRADHIHFNSLQSSRKSDNTYNYYTELIDTLPAFKDFPKRSRSLICTPSKTKAKPYGKLYKIFPFDGAKIGICPHKDIWDSKIALWRSQISFASFNLFLHHLGIKESNVISELRRFDEALSDDKKFSLLNQIVPAYFNIVADEIRTTFFSDIVDAFTPDNLGFRWVYAKDVDMLNIANSEIWVEGEMLAQHI